MAKRNAKKKRDLEQAARNHIGLFGPSTSSSIASSAKLNSGKLLKDTRYGLTAPQVTALLKGNPSFRRVSHRLDYRETARLNRPSHVWIWTLTD
jgi:hypothetical protein